VTVRARPTQHDWAERSGTRVTGRDVSVVVPTHRRPELLARALDAVLGQTSLPGEILVVDDAGDSQTERVVHARQDQEPVAVRYVRNPDANGPSGSRNLGAARAVGSVLAFLDDDDLWEPGYLDQAVGLLDAADLVLTPLETIRIDRSGATVGRWVREIDLSGPSERVLARNPGVTGSNIVIDRGLFERCGGYDADLWIAEDNEFLARLLDAGARTRIADSSLAKQMVHMGSRLSRGGQRRVDGCRNLVRKTFAVTSPRTRRRLAFIYFTAKKDAASDHWSRWRYRIYAWSLAEPSQLVRRARWRAVMWRDSMRTS
jgi:glycosyltransferase involved in cell wall biosynthesis